MCAFRKSSLCKTHGYFLTKVVNLNSNQNIKILYFFLVDGKWGDWSPYNQCTKTCGNDGIRSRRRDCNKPSPLNGGKYCFGNIIDRSRCFLMPCPTPGSKNLV